MRQTTESIHAPIIAMFWDSEGRLILALPFRQRGEICLQIAPGLFAEFRFDPVYAGGNLADSMDIIATACGFAGLTGVSARAAHPVLCPTNALQMPAEATPKPRLAPERAEKSKQPQERVDALGQQGMHGDLDSLGAGNIQGPAQGSTSGLGDIPSPEQCLQKLKELFASQGDQRPGASGKPAVSPEDVDPLGGYSRLGNGPSPFSPAYSRFNQAMLKKIPVVDKELFIIITCLQQARESLWSTFLQFAEDVEREGKIND